MSLHMYNAKKTKYCMASIFFFMRSKVANPPFSKITIQNQTFAKCFHDKIWRFEGKLLFSQKIIIMAKNSDYIRFDWAIKRILRDKANFAVLEGLMTVLIGEKITIIEILESESNSNSREDKYNRVDVKAKTSKGEIIIVEVQLGRESFFMPRILFGVSKAIFEQIKLSQNYEDIRKVYSINILYFNLGKGEDYAYHGKFKFTGMTNPESELVFSENEKKIYSWVHSGDSIRSIKEKGGYF